VGDPRSDLDAVAAVVGDLVALARVLAADAVVVAEDIDAVAGVRQRAPTAAHADEVALHEVQVGICAQHALLDVDAVAAVPRDEVGLACHRAADQVAAAVEDRDAVPCITEGDRPRGVRANVTTPDPSLGAPHDLDAM